MQVRTKRRLVEGIGEARAERLADARAHGVGDVAEVETAEDQRAARLVPDEEGAREERRLLRPRAVMPHGRSRAWRGRAARSRSPAWPSRPRYMVRTRYRTGRPAGRSGSGHRAVHVGRDLGELGRSARGLDEAREDRRAPRAASGARGRAPRAPGAGAPRAPRTARAAPAPAPGARGVPAPPASSPASSSARPRHDRRRHARQPRHLDAVAPRRRARRRSGAGRRSRPSTPRTATEQLRTRGRSARSAVSSW